jgi:hypothetical protein
MELILSNPVNQGNLSKYWPHACKQLWTYGKADYGYMRSIGARKVILVTDPILLK